MEENGLIYAGEHGVAVTWMDAIVNGKPVTPRTGFAVEINALWYNAIRFAIECAEHAGDRKFIVQWTSLLEQIELSFNETFWNDEKGYLADCVDGAYHDWSLRPNQIIAVSLPYSPLNVQAKKAIVDIVKSNLLTPRGLRTLSPEDQNYKGTYAGSQSNRDAAYHQGTVWPWLLGHFAEAYLKVNPEDGYELLQSIYENFAPAVTEYGIGSIAEIYDGDAPYTAKGAISQAWSVAEILRMRELLVTHSHMEGVQAQKQLVETI
jgi:glycogen debranching enzyme